MSIKEKKSFMAIFASSEESVKEPNIEQENSHDQMESDDSSTAPNHKLSLEFRCSDTPSDQRKLCESFWKTIDQHPDMDRFMARGWSEKEALTKAKSTKKKSRSPTYCDELQELLDHSVDKLVLMGVKNMNNDCLTDLKVNHSSTYISEDLQDFDRNVKTEISIPPKTPRPSRSQQEM